MKPRGVLRLGAAVGAVAPMVACGETGPSRAEAARLEAGELQLEIGVFEGERAYEFSAILEVDALPDGSILVADGGTRELSLFGPDGGHRWTAAGHGDAPGELSFMTWAGHADSTVVAWDLSRRRLMRYRAADGAFLDAISMTSLEPFSWVFGRFSDGSVLAMTEDIGPPEVPGGLLPNEGSFLRVPADGEPELVARFEGAPWADVQGILQQAPLTVRARAEVRGDTVWMLRPAEPGFRLLAPDGSGHTAAGDTVRRPLTDEIRRAYREARLAEMREERRSLEAERLETIDMLGTVPTYDELVVSTGRRVWLRRFEVPPGSTAAPTARWDVFGPDGTLAARAELPGAFTLEEAGPDYVLGVWKDELGVNYVRRYTLVEAGPDP